MSKEPAQVPQRVGPQKYSHGFFDPEIAHLRAIVFKILGGALVITTIVMWIVLPVYWGSLWKAPSYTNKLKVLVVDLDTPTSPTGSLGQAIVQACTTNLAGIVDNVGEVGHKTPKGTLGWVNATDGISVEDAIHQVLEEHYWAALIINANATNSLLSARQIGNTSYNPTSAITFYYNQGRNELVAANYLLPITTKVLTAALAKYNSESVSAYLSAISGNTTALNTLIQVPQTISSGMSYTMDNLRPYTAPVATAVTLVGLIYLLIFAFIVTMNWNAAREIIAPFLTTKALLISRIVIPPIIYLWLSFAFAMINLPFKVPFGAKFSYGGGFFLWWIFLFMGMWAVGGATEFFITILGPKFVAFSLVFLIIFNVSVVSYPHELQPWFYHYSAAAPYAQLSKAVRTIIFNTKNTLGEAMGIIIAWVVFSIITVTIATYLFRVKETNELAREMGENENREKEGERV